MSLEACDFLKKIDPHHWTRSHFKTQFKCDMLLNNLCESFNSIILEARTKGVITLNEIIRTNLMTRIQRKRDAMERCQTMHCPNILKKLEKAKTMSWLYRTTWSGGHQYQVMGLDGQFVVDNHEKTCTCRRWQLTGLPCCHAISAIYYNHDKPENHIDDYYRVSTYLNTYRHILYPTEGRECWPKSSYSPMLPPQPVHKHRGRRPLLRRRDPDEEVGFTKGKVSRKGSKITCSICGATGHNKRFHGVQGDKQNAGNVGASDPCGTSCNNEDTTNDPRDIIDHHVLQDHYQQKVVPLNTWVLISNFKLAYNMQRRPDGTFDRHLHEFLDRKVPANAVPVDGVISYDRVIDRSTNLLVRVYRPSETAVSFPVIVFFHGGSFAHSSVNTAIYDSLCRRLLRHCTPAVVISVNYRRSPEHRYPCAYDDGWAALKWAVSEPWLASSRFFLAGDSSGGNIAHHVAVRAVKSGIPISGNILLNPMFGGEQRTESELRLDGKYFVTIRDRDWYWKAFLPDGADRDHPACNPFGPQSGEGLEGVSTFPRSLVVVAGLDLIRDWQLKYVEGLRNAGQQVKLVLREHATVGFYLLPNNDHCHEVMNQIANFVLSLSSHDNYHHDNNNNNNSH